MDGQTIELAPVAQSSTDKKDSSFLPPIDQKEGGEAEFEGGDSTKANLVAPSPMIDENTLEEIMDKSNYMRLSLISGEKIKDAIESYNFMQDLLTSIKSERTFNKLTLTQIFILIYIMILNNYHYSDEEQNLIKDADWLATNVIKQ